MSTPTPLQLQ
ncbi:unnamed protein product, partial [Adineta steineri]